MKTFIGSGEDVIIRQAIDGTYHRVTEDNGYLFYAEPEPDEMGQPVKPVPETSDPIPFGVLS